MTKMSQPGTPPKSVPTPKPPASAPQPRLQILEQPQVSLSFVSHQSGGGIPIPMSQFIPPNGFAGFAQQTPAVQALYRGGRRAGSKRRRKRTTAKKAAPRRRRRVAAKAGGKFTKGSAAARRHMAKLRKMRKRK